jgi:hypothetical protein
VLLLHPAGPARYLVYRANLQEVLSQGAVDQDLAVSPRDIVVVPMTYIGQVDQFVDQYIRKVLPFSTGISYSYIANPVGNTVNSAATSSTSAK